MTTPPPTGNPFAQGQNPYAQGQQPSGQPQGQAPYPPQGGYPQQPGQPGFPPQGAAPYAPAPPQQPGRRFSFKTIKNVAAVVIVGIMLIVGYIISLDDAENAAVGDCLKSASSSSSSNDRMEVVDCTSSEAEAKVLKKIDGTYTSLTAETECRKVSGATSFYAQTGDGDNFLLCLSDV
ncbi:LppU/SCO3897 family protein [Streptomyces sp. Marseille-Q5077]|uniref:LppU/SCO3897 family protein n=1 Tax=Streptomyces sp. Marseille-Q5077 TaxID=3418995 RepID=UPI003D08FB70